MCALKKKVLLQGRMYVFGEHVCFHSSLFGYVKKKVGGKRKAPAAGGAQ